MRARGSVCRGQEMLSEEDLDKGTDFNSRNSCPADNILPTNLTHFRVITLTERHRSRYPSCVISSLLAVTRSTQLYPLNAPSFFKHNCICLLLVINGRTVATDIMHQAYTPNPLLRTLAETFQIQLTPDATAAASAAVEIHRDGPYSAE